MRCAMNRWWQLLVYGLVMSGTAHATTVTFPSVRVYFGGRTVDSVAEEVVNEAAYRCEETRAHDCQIEWTALTFEDFPGVDGVVTLGRWYQSYFHGLDPQGQPVRWANPGYPDTELYDNVTWHCFNDYKYQRNAVKGNTCVLDTALPITPANLGAPPPPFCPVGNPVNPATGVKYQREDDFAIRDFEFWRLINVVQPDMAPLASMGLNWRHSYDYRITIDDGVAIFLRPDGKQWLFSLQNGIWTALVDVRMKLTVSGDVTRPTTWILDDGMGRVETYDASGYLSTVNDHGHHYRFAYVAQSLLDQHATRQADQRD